MSDIQNHEYKINVLIAYLSLKQVKVAMKFVTDSSLQLRAPDNYQDPSTRNVLELYFNTRQDNALLYFAGGPLPTVGSYVL